MPIKVEAEPDAMGPHERCCFCRKPTEYWYTPKDVACCGDCARRAKPEDVPSKVEWSRRERIADPPPLGMD